MKENNCQDEEKLLQFKMKKERERGRAEIRFDQKNALIPDLGSNRGSIRIRFCSREG